jgi:hypothetical protein
MPLTPIFSIKQQPDLKTVILTDESTGADAGITTRYIYFKKADGTYLVPTGTSTIYIEWPLSDGLTKTIANFLLYDYGFDVIVEWRSISSVLYSVTELVCLPAYAKAFAYYLVQLQQANTAITKRADFFMNKVKLYGFIKDAENSVDTGGDIASCQQSLNNARKLISSPQIYFT